MQQEERIEDLHQRAAGQYLQGEFAEALDLWNELLRVDPQDERAIEGVRLCELLSGKVDPGAESPESLALSAAEEDAFGSTVSIDLGEGPGADASGQAPSQSGGTSAADAAALELGRRVDELLRQATTAWEAGDRETAANLIARVFILDEHNATAIRLNDAIQTEADAPAAAAPGRTTNAGRSAPQPPSEFELPIDVEHSLLDALPAGAAAMPVEEAADAPPAPATYDWRGQAAEAACDPAPAASDESIQAQVAPRRAPGLRRALALTGLAVAAVAGAWLTWHFLAPARGKAAVESVTSATPAQPKARAPKAKPKQAEAPPAPRPPVAAAPGESAATLVAAARAAIESGANADAIIACNRALELQPGHPEATALLAQAAEEYKVQREREAKVQGARDLFQAGDYAGALKVFYRLPEAQGQPRFERYKANGWFNLALRALSAGSCADARSSAGEAGTLAPRDPQVAELQRLARACAGSRNDAAFQAATAAMPFRGLED